jgi:lysophospholipase L1-like esterase
VAQQYGLRAWLILLLRIALVAAILEGGTRLLFGVKGYFDRDLPECYTYSTVRCRVTTFNEELGEVVIFAGPAGISLAPNFHGEWVTTNAQGLRDPDDTQLLKAPGTLRIVTIGASGMWGAYVHDDETIPYYLEQELSSRTTQPVEVINAAIPGAVSFQELIHLQAVVLPLQPDLVVIYDGRNDLYFANSPKWSPLLTPASLNALDAQTRRQQGDTGPLGNELWQVVVRYSKFFNTLDLMFRVIQAGQQNNSTGAAIATDHPEAVAAYADHLGLMAQTLQANHIPAIFVLQPILWANAKPINPEEQVIIDRAGSAYQSILKLYPQAQAAIKTLGEQYDVPALDYTGIFADYTERMYLDEVHPTPAGNRLIAQQLAQDIVETLAIK